MAKGENGVPKEVIFKGMASVDVVDADGETVNQSGLDWKRFWTPGNARGRLTDGHPYRRDRVVGEPVRLSPATMNGRPATLLEGRLYMQLPRAQELYRQHNLMRKSGASNGLGYSIEGHAILRSDHGRRIEKAVVTSVAIDAMPKNPYSYIEPIAASMAGMFRDTFLGSEGAAADAARQAIFSAMDPHMRRRAGLMKGLSDEDLMVARVLHHNPKLTGREARALVQFHLQLHAEK